MQILVATHNLHKLKELEMLFKKLPIQLLSLKDFPEVEEPIENGKSFKQNALLKAQYYYNLFKIPVISDDSGLSISYLNGQPGILSRRYSGGNDDDNIDLVLQKLNDINNRKAQFVCHLTYIDNQNIAHHFKGYAKGTIINKKKGTNGFGYDPIFIPNNYDKTFAEMLDIEKNQISHRAKAYYKMKDYLDEILNIK